MTTAQELLPAARWRDVVTGRAALIGSRLDPARPRGRFSPIEARVLLGLAYEEANALEVQRLGARSRTGDLMTLVSALLARLLVPAGHSEPRPWIVSSRIDNVSAQTAIERIVAADRVPPSLVCFVHPHALNLASRDHALRTTLARADLVLPDGVGIRLAARLLGRSLAHNVNGTDLLPPLCAAAAAAGVPIVLVGAAPGVAEVCATRLRADHPGLVIPRVSHGFLDEAASTRLAAELAGLGRVIVLVGMGSPRQEAWAARHLAGLAEVTSVTVGGLFDFYADRIPRAPVAWRELGLEWLWRLRQEPGRMWRRYVIGNPLFLARVLGQRARLALRPPPPLLGP